MNSSYFAAPTLIAMPEFGGTFVTKAIVRSILKPGRSLGMTLAVTLTASGHVRFDGRARRLTLVPFSGE